MTEVATRQAVGLTTLGLLRPQEARKRVGELSMGQQRRLDLALLLAARPHLLLLDEPTNHLSIALVDELVEALGETPAAVVLSSHDRQLLRDVAAWPRLVLAPADGTATALAAPAPAFAERRPTGGGPGVTAGRIGGGAAGARTVGP